MQLITCVNLPFTLNFLNKLLCLYFYRLKQISRCQKLLLHENVRWVTLRLISLVYWRWGLGKNFVISAWIIVKLYWALIWIHSASIWIMNLSNIAHMQLRDKLWLLVWGIILFCCRLVIRLIVFLDNHWIDLNQWTGFIFYNFSNAINIFFLPQIWTFIIWFIILCLMDRLWPYFRNWWQNFLIFFLLLVWILIFWRISKFTINWCVFLVAFSALWLLVPIRKRFFRVIAKI